MDLLTFQNGGIQIKNKIITILTCGFLSLGINGCVKDFDVLKGKWIATIENQNIYQINKNGKTVGGKEDYILDCDGNGNYILTLENKETINGKYIIEKDNRITFKDDSDLLVEVCMLSNDNEINCDEMSTYAFKYIRYSK